MIRGADRSVLLRRLSRVVAALATALPLLVVGCGGTDGEPGAGAGAVELRSWAEVRLAAGDAKAAVIGFRRALQHDSLDVAALSGLASTYELQKRTEAADRYRRRAFQIHYDRGTAHLAAGWVDSARAAFLGASVLLPRHPLARLRLGQVELAAGRLDSAIAHFEGAVEADPRFIEALVALGGAYLQAQRTTDAERLLERAVTANVNAVDAYLGLGTIYGERGDWARAAAQYETVLLIDPRSEAAGRGLERARAGLQGR